MSVLLLENVEEYNIMSIKKFCALSWYLVNSLNHNARSEEHKVHSNCFDNYRRQNHHQALSLNYLKWPTLSLLSDLRVTYLIFQVYIIKSVLK